MRGFFVGQFAVMALICAGAQYGAAATFSLTADGRKVQVAEFSTQYDYATLSHSGACKLEVAREDGQAISKFEVSPLKLKIAGKVRGAKLDFAIEKPAYLIVSIDALKKLVIAVDAEETEKPAPSGAGIFNVTAPAYHTAGIQRAIDDAADGGIVYVPAGVYHVGQLVLPSNVSLYLAEGAVLRCSGEAYSLKYHKRSQNRDGFWFITTKPGAENVRIFGRGTIDGNGKELVATKNISNALVVPMNCKGFTMDGVVLRDSGMWGTVIANCSNVRLKNTKHFNYLDIGEDDCVDVCNSQDVTIEHSIGISLDDPYSTKTWGPGTDITKNWSGELAANRNIVIDDCVAWTRCFAFKIGAGVWADQRDITIRNGVVFDAAHAIGISHSYGSADARNITFDGIDVERTTCTNLGRSWARFVIDPRKSDDGVGGGVYDVTVKNIGVRDAGTEPVEVKGLSEAKKIRGLTFENISMPGEARMAGTLEEIGIASSSFAEGVVVRNEAAGVRESNQTFAERSK